MASKNILIIEDDPAITDVYRTALESEGFKVQNFTLGRDAEKFIALLQAGAPKKPDVILLDLILPDMNGSEIFLMLKKSDATKDILVYVMTNQDGVELSTPGGQKPDKLIIKANITPTNLIDLINGK